MSSEDSEDETKSAYCIECGQNIAADTNYCPECGSPQDFSSKTETVSSSDESGETDETEEKSSTEELGRYLAWIWGGLLILMALGAFASGSFRGVAAGLLAAGLGLLFIPAVREKLNIGEVPGIEETNSDRRNVLTGVGYGFLSIIAVGIALPDTTEDSPAGGGQNNAGTGDSEPNNEPTQAEYPNAWAYDESSGLVLNNVEGTIGQYSTEITGEAKNVSGNDYDYVQLTFGLYDETDAKVGDALANTSGLDAGQRWRFEAMSTQTENVSSFSLESTSAF